MVSFCVFIFWCVSLSFVFGSFAMLGSSPSGVNRRTAVLFTRKAQAALKKPTDEKDEKESSPADAAPKQ